ncbi:MAG: flagellar basal body P-ring protein FlgI [Longimicrobiales bacterium]
MSRSLLAVAVVVAVATRVAAQEVRIGDLTATAADVPIRVVGYGLVTGLDGTGDRAIGGFGARHTVQSIANLLRNFDVEVPPEVLRTRNVAAVLVTAEASPYLRAGGRFDVNVSSLGDAVSLRGGVLWMTPLVYEAGGNPVGTAQGPLMISEGRTGRNAYTVETTARIPAGGLLLGDLPRATFGSASRLVLRQPNLGTAIKIAAAINGDVGEGTARVEDPGSIQLTLPADATGAGPAVLLARIADLRVEPDQRAQIIVDVRDGTVIAGGNLVVGPAVVSHGGLTLTVGATGTGEPTPGEVRVAPGATVQDVAASLHAVGAPPQSIAAVFDALRVVGALAAEVNVR